MEGSGSGRFSVPQGLIGESEVIWRLLWKCNIHERLKLLLWRVAKMIVNWVLVVFGERGRNRERILLAALIVDLLWKLNSWPLKLVFDSIAKFGWTNMQWWNLM